MPQLASATQGWLTDVAKTIANPPYKQKGAKLEKQTDVPLVLIRRELLKWITQHQEIEESARARHRDMIDDLFDIATADDPAKEAKSKSERPPQTVKAALKFLAGEREEFPKTAKAALKMLADKRDELTPTPSDRAAPPDLKSLRNLQLLIESVIWATTYDFTLGVDQPVTPTPGEATSTDVDMYLVGDRESKFVAPPLPSALWKRLTERYIDPIERKPFGDAGTISRIGGTVKEPFIPPRKNVRYPPEVRLAHYFNHDLFRGINQIEETMLRLVSARLRT